MRFSEPSADPVEMADEFIIGGHGAIMAPYAEYTHSQNQNRPKSQNTSPNFGLWCKIIKEKCRDSKKFFCTMSFFVNPG